MRCLTREVVIFFLPLDGRKSETGEIKAEDVADEVGANVADGDDGSADVPVADGDDSTESHGRSGRFRVGLWLPGGSCQGRAWLAGEPALPDLLPI